MHGGLEWQHLWIKGLSTNHVHNFPWIHFSCISAFPFDLPMQSNTYLYVTLYIIYRIVGFFEVLKFCEFCGFDKFYLILFGLIALDHMSLSG